MKVITINKLYNLKLYIEMIFQLYALKYNNFNKIIVIAVVIVMVVVLAIRKKMTNYNNNNNNLEFRI